MLLQVNKARDVGINSVVLFPKIPDALKVFLQLPPWLHGILPCWDLTCKNTV